MLKNINPKYQHSVKKRKLPTVEDILIPLFNKEKVALSQSITLIESENPKHQKIVKKLINNCLPKSGKSIRIGITGVPGVGKSTFIEALGLKLIDMGKRVAVLAVDPSSSISKGSILGDKTRMSTLVTQQNAFIRPTASGSSLGGVARKTRETIILCEAAGYDVILVETVGVGQSETAVHGMTDFFLLLKLSGAGDQLQGIKRGIIEMADAILINKADGENLKAAQKAKVEFEKALHLYPIKENKWTPKVNCISAVQNKGIDKAWYMIQTYMQSTKKNGYFESNRLQQQKYWLYESINQKLKQNFYQNQVLEKEMIKQIKNLEHKKLSSFTAAEILFDLYLKLLKEE